MTGSSQLPGTDVASSSRDDQGLGSLSESALAPIPERLGQRTPEAGASIVSRLVHAWRRSLQFRVVTTTMLLGMLVLGVVGSYLYQRIGDRLVQSRTDQATAEALSLTTEWLSTNVSSYVINPVVSGEVNDSHIPDELETAVAEDPAVQKVQIVSIPLTGESDLVPCLVVGQQLDLPLARGTGIYYVYPLQRERSSLAVISQIFLSGGFVLVALIGGVAYVVTRLVVTPVRQAAMVAERLAAGRLTERMVARGEDDLASLATSFNAMAEGLQRQIRQLEDLSRVQQRFVSDVSHELRTPLTTIRMAGELIHDSRAQFEPAVARSAELLRGELDRFEALLADLLEVSRFDAGAAVLDVEPTDLRRTVAKVVDGCQQLAERKGSRITVRDPGVPCEATYDPRRVERVLRNLIVNGIEHGEGKPLEIRVAGNDGAVAVVVRDHGVGLRPGESGQVFNRFWRADPARARTTGGTGLGLAIALEDARLHSGWLQAWGAPGEGSSFRLTLPRSPGTHIASSPLPLKPVVESPEDPT
jgi:two-component system sensor histidine kinase MtrB